MKARESAQLAAKRWELLSVLQHHYKQFPDFLHDAMAELGFGVTEQQLDIADYLVDGGQYIMVQAQRSQAKTTLTACLAIWSLIHAPQYRILIVSSSGPRAQEISTMIVRLIMSMPGLACMRPDREAGDKSSTEAFDIHHSLKGLDKSPSIACLGIESNIQGARADILIPDDVESKKNSDTAKMRAKLLELTRDFTSINAHGRIIWLGTPQSRDSIYNSLPARGVQIRIWPGRFPTPEQRTWYGTRLAPRLARMLDADPSLGTGGGLLGNQGKPTDPQLLGEAALQAKERDQGEAYFQLQHMLNTQLADAQRYPLKPNLLVFARTSGDRVPLTVVRGMASTDLVDLISAGYGYQLTAPHELSRETATFGSVIAYVDPAAGGANADETAYAVGFELNSSIWLLSVGAVPGGYDNDKLEDLARRLARHKPKVVVIEKNMGYGAFRHVFQPVLFNHWICGIEDDLVTGQKEKRIIETLGPIMGRGALIVTPEAQAEDASCCVGYSAAVAPSYSLFHQLAHMTTDRGAVLHDDRADAVEGLCRRLQPNLMQDQQAIIARAQRAEWEKWVRNPLGLPGMGGPPNQRGQRSTLKHRRGR